MSEKYERQAVLKATNKDKRLVYCVVAEPDAVDLQDDTWTADEIEKTAHAYAVNCRVVGDAHRKDKSGNLVVAPADVVESYIAPVDFEVEGEKVLKGSWVVVIKANDSALWQNILDGQYDGVSIGGTGYRTPV